MNIDEDCDKKVEKVSAPKRKKNIKMNAPISKQAVKKEQQEVQEVQNQNNHFLGYIPIELTENIKGIVTRGLSLPHKHPNKMHCQLKSSEYTNAYLNKYMMLDYLAMFNDHVKFILVYGMAYVKALEPDNIIIIKKNLDINNNDNKRE